MVARYINFLFVYTVHHTAKRMKNMTDTIAVGDTESKCVYGIFWVVSATQSSAVSPHDRGIVVTKNVVFVKKYKSMFMLPKNIAIVKTPTAGRFEIIPDGEIV